MDRTILIWDTHNSYDNVGTLKSQTNAITCLAWSHTDRLISGSADKSVANWDVEMQKIVRKYKGHTGIVHAVATPARTRDLLASVGDDGTVRVWDQRSKEEMRIVEGKYPVTSVCFDLNGDRVFFGGIDNTIRMYSVGEDTVEEEIHGHQDTISSLELSHDGAYLMSNSFDETLRIWDIRGNAQQRLAKTMSGHSQGNEKTLTRGCWSRDGLYVSCGSIDRCVYIWDTATRKIAQRLGGHNGTVTQVTMGENNTMASSSNDKTIIVSELP